MNKFVHKQLFKYLELNNILNYAQSEFNSRYFTVIALKLLETFSLLLDQSLFRGAILITLYKALLTLLVILT